MRGMAGVGSAAADVWTERMARVAPHAAGALSRSLGIPRAAAAEAFAGTAALVLAGVARHGRRRGAQAAATVVAKYGRPADLGAPALAVAGHLAREDLNPRLGGLLGDDAVRFCSWLAGRTRGDPKTLGRAVAAVAPLALGALDGLVSPEPAADALGGVGDDVLAEPARLLDATQGGGAAFRRLSRAGRPWIARVFRPS